MVSLLGAPDVAGKKLWKRRVQVYDSNIESSVEIYGPITTKMHEISITSNLIITHHIPDCVDNQ